MKVPNYEYIINHIIEGEVYCGCRFQLLGHLRVLRFMHTAKNRHVGFIYFLLIYSFSIILCSLLVGFKNFQ